MNNERTTQRPNETGPQQDVPACDVIQDHAPRHLSFAENVILTIKVLAGAGLVLAALWGMNVWTSVQ
jgi:hypothetical protein